MLASEHTRLINRFIGLCNDTKGWPSILYDVGYKVQLIEQTLRLRAGGEVKPDVVAVSSKYIHVLVADCKSGKNINREQEGKYRQLTSDVLLRFVDVYDESRMRYQFCYVDQEKYHPRLKQYTEFPFITFGDNSLQGEGDFGNQHVNKALHKTISLDGMREPTSYYPFSHEDKDYVIAPYVLRGVVSYLKKRGNTKKHLNGEEVTTELLEQIHHFHRMISIDHKNQLIRKIRAMLRVFMHKDGFKDCIEKIEKGEETTATLQKLSTVCEEMITQYKQERKITEYF